MAAAPTIETTAVSEAALAQANSTRPDFDRGAFNPRGPMGVTGKTGKMAGFVGIGALAIMMLAFSSHTTAKQKSAGTDGFQVDDKGAEVAARQAAATLVEEPKTGAKGAKGAAALPPGTQVVGTDPLGNPILGQPDPGQIVPAIGAQPAGAAQSATREEEVRRAALEQARARQSAMRRAPIMAVNENIGSRESSGTRAAYDRLPVDRPSMPSSDTGELGKRGTELEQRLTTSSIPTVRASRLPNRNFLITAGNQIPCVLQTAMDSTQPGLSACVIPVNVYSDNGRVILMEKGTRVLGEYQGGFSTGEHRIFVVWNRAVTPAGVSVELGSPAADELGRAGMGGKVSNFFWQRFGGALLLSIVGDAGNALSNSVSGAQLTANAPNQAAAIAAQDARTIKPRLTASQGAEMTIFVARDVDFSSIYSLHLQR